MWSTKKKHKFIKHELFNKGEKRYALISPSSDPRLLFPVKVIIKDIKFEEYNPKYLVKIIKFYDSFTYLKNNFLDIKFVWKFDANPKPFNKDILNAVYGGDVKTTEELINKLYENSDRNCFVVDSIFVTQLYDQLEKLFIDLQDYFIESSIKDLKFLTTRAFYKGQYSIQTHRAFFNRLRKFIGDLVTKWPWDSYINKL